MSQQATEAAPVIGHQTGRHGPFKHYQIPTTDKLTPVVLRTDKPLYLPSVGDARFEGRPMFLGLPISHPTVKTIYNDDPTILKVYLGAGTALTLVDIGTNFIEVSKYVYPAFQGQNFLAFLFTLAFSIGVAFADILFWGSFNGLFKKSIRAPHHAMGVLAYGVIGVYDLKFTADPLINAFKFEWPFGWALSLGTSAAEVLLIDAIIDLAKVRKEWKKQLVAGFATQKP